ncbi:hypothetical protein HOY82DRAFT_541911 [Tuber indicum]|nr:hypothetical protein HOY82DRAFT_541911 [Tuber indicum]
MDSIISTKQLETDVENWATFLLPLLKAKIPLRCMKYKVRYPVLVHSFNREEACKNGQKLLPLPYLCTDPDGDETKILESIWKGSRLLEFRHKTSDYIGRMPHGSNIYGDGLKDLPVEKVVYRECGVMAMVWDLKRIPWKKMTASFGRDSQTSKTPMTEAAITGLNPGGQGGVLLLSIRKEKGKPTCEIPTSLRIPKITTDNESDANVPQCYLNLMSKITNIEFSFPIRWHYMMGALSKPIPRSREGLCLSKHYLKNVCGQSIDPIVYIKVGGLEDSVGEKSYKGERFSSQIDSVSSIQTMKLLWTLAVPLCGNEQRKVFAIRVGLPGIIDALPSPHTGQTKRQNRQLNEKSSKRSQECKSSYNSMVDNSPSILKSESIDLDLYTECDERKSTCPVAT